MFTAVLLVSGYVHVIYTIIDVYAADILVSGFLCGSVLIRRNTNPNPNPKPQPLTLTSNHKPQP